MQYTRFLRNRSVTAEEMSAHAAAKSAQRAIGRNVIAIQDTCELALGGGKAKAQGFGPVGRHGVSFGLLLHAVIALDGDTAELIGAVDLNVRNRPGRVSKHRRSREPAEKESQRWLAGIHCAGKVLSQASHITVVSDRESDIFEDFVRRPSHVDLVLRAAQNRSITGSNGAKSPLFAFADSLPEQHRLSNVAIPGAPGRKPRMTDLAIRFSQVEICKPLHTTAKDLPETVTLTLLDIREPSKPQGGEAVHWRILTTLSIANQQDAKRVLEIYRMRWRIEEYFRTLKSAGFEIEDAEIGDPHAMTNFVVASAIAATTVMQLVQARDGNTNQSLLDAFEPQDQPLLEAICTKLEGKTERQKNPHPKGTMAYAAWAIARLGGWDGYYGKAGPLVMRRGIYDFQQIKFGTSLVPLLDV
jgi:hypothetical protein